MNIHLAQICNNLPSLITLILQNPGSWLVGSAIGRLENVEIPKDYDIIIENEDELNSIISRLRGFGGNESLSKMGAHKFKIHDLVIDIWHQKLGDFLCKANRVSYVLTLNPDIILLKSVI